MLYNNKTMMNEAPQPNPDGLKSQEMQLQSRTHLITLAEGEAHPFIAETKEGQLDLLVKEIKDHEGKLEILVHPFCEEYGVLPQAYKEELAKGGDLSKNLVECNRQINELLTNPDRPPLLILEDRKHLDAYVAHCISHDLNPNRDAWLMPTFGGMGTLFLRPGDGQSPPNFRHIPM